MYVIRTFSGIILVTVLTVMGCGGGDDDGDLAGQDPGTGMDPGGSEAGSDLADIIIPKRVFTIEGQVMGEKAGQELGVPVAMAVVKASVDLDNDGTIGEDETVETKTDAKGEYTLEVTSPSGKARRVALSFYAKGYTPFYRILMVQHDGAITFDAFLSALTNLTCGGSRCFLDTGGLEVNGLGEGITGGARLFNPVGETDRFPGEFADDEGNMLFSAVFSTVELKDASGNAIHELDSPAVLRMMVPRDTWPILHDIKPGDDRIEVPMYYYDETQGTWVLDGSGHLETADGVIIPEEHEDDIRSRTYKPMVFAAASVTHFTPWNVDYPPPPTPPDGPPMPPPTGPIGGTVTLEDGERADGAMVLVTPLTYIGITAPFVVGPDGRFCHPVLRSENVDEDLDFDTVTGENHKVSIEASYKGKLYDLGTFTTEESTGNCLAEGSQDVGPLALNPDTEMDVKLCTANGRVISHDGEAVEGAKVTALVKGISDDTMQMLCETSDQGVCNLEATTAADGYWEIVVPVLQDLEIQATHEVKIGEASGFLKESRLFDRCPGSGTDIYLSNGQLQVVLDVGISDGYIFWLPDTPVNTLTVESQDGTLKWGLWSDTGMATPVEYGVVPADALQTVPENGQPGPLVEESDLVFVTGYGYQDGFTYLASGQHGELEAPK